MKYIIKVLLILCVLLFSFTLLSAKEYKVVIAQLPVSEIYSNLLKAISEETNNTFTVEIVPFGRLLHHVENDLADIGCPIISLKNIKKQEKLKYDISTTDILEMVFVLYVNKNINIDVNELKNGNPKKYKIETDYTHVDLFDFDCKPSNDIEASLKRVEKGIIDGFIFAQGSTDKMLKNGDYKNIKRIFYDTFTLKFVIKKGSQGGEIDRILTIGINEIKSNGKYEKIIGEYARKVKIFNNNI
ncbi:MAG: hypothetical protein A2086_09360 [Spirochaetes bacterium GWD1_27_9]|nr:MAG: hypothetical protein A2Z98_18295 [Spirochaetes bacterium GWB1_27_13]OHD24098.1 MAG: hypothetical protein A2Y34_09335 [Spirochaetes bacterium GWC1_27_15]OHD37368.1 MAG: hypothetical protein A2086_09360 [Spirochaetes bacterium GWD1_27_9]